ncbi:hypothetical protein [Hungatella effluvii]|uniref:hypothetical protein n=1 Tax=Hungatella effluvii TaxID=1096246 RepID=UPI0022E266F5|nr:hypothetical protein [Hungatella effluvii]
MQVNIIADCFKLCRGYNGAKLELPASRYAIEDALERAHVPEGGGYKLACLDNWPGFLKHKLIISGEKTLEEVNLLANQISRMNETQLGAYEGILKLREESDIDHPISIKELINAAYNVDIFEFHPGITDDYDLGVICMQEEMLDWIKNLPDEVFELLDEVKVGQELRRSEQGVFTSQGYVYCSSKDWKEVYDGVYLPEQPDNHIGMISLRLVSVNSTPDTDSGVWLELPANGQVMRDAFTSLGESSFDTCVIVESKSILPALEFVGDEDIDKLNTLAERIKAFPSRKVLTKYKAALELEACNDLDMELDIANNLDCYTFNDRVYGLESYAEILLQQGGINTDDPEFNSFDFKGYGERRSQKCGQLVTAYGCINHNINPFILEYTKPSQSGITIQ